MQIHDAPVTHDPTNIRARPATWDNNLDDNCNENGGDRCAKYATTVNARHMRPIKRVGWSIKLFERSPTKKRPKRAFESGYRAW